MPETDKRVLDHEDVDSYTQTIVYRAIKYAQKIDQKGGDPVFIRASHPSSLQEGVKVYDADRSLDGIEFLVGLSNLKGDMKNASERFQDLVDEKGRDPGKNMAFYASYIFENMD